MQCRSSKKDLIRVTVDEEIEFKFDCSYTGSGYVDKQVSVENSYSLADFLASSDKKGHLTVDAKPRDCETTSSITNDVKLENLDKALQPSTQCCEQKTSTSLLVKNEAGLFAWRLQKAERISVVQNRLLDIALSLTNMPSRSRSRGRKKGDRKSSSFSKSRKKENEPTDIKAEQNRLSDTEKGRQLRNRSKHNCIEEKPPAPSWSPDNRDVAGNALVLGSRLESAKRRTRSQSMSIDRDENYESVMKTTNMGYKERRGRRMERRCQNTSTIINISPFCEKKISPKVGMKAKTVDEKSYTVVELEDISSVLQSECGTRTVRSISLSRLASSLKPDLQINRNEGVVARNARSLSRNRGGPVKELQPALGRELTESRKSEALPSSKQLRRMTSTSNNTGIIHKYTNKTFSRKSKIEITHNLDQKAEVQNGLEQSIDNPESGTHTLSAAGSDFFSDEEFSESDDEEIKTPTFVCRCCDDEFTSRFDLHEHLVNFHKITKSTAILPPSPPCSDSPEGKSCSKKAPKKSVSFGCPSQPSLDMSNKYQKDTESQCVAIETVREPDEYRKDVECNDFKCTGNLFREFNLKKLSVPVKRCEFSNRLKHSAKSAFLTDIKIQNTETLNKRSADSVKGTIEIYSCDRELLSGNNISDNSILETGRFEGTEATTMAILTEKRFCNNEIILGSQNRGVYPISKPSHAKKSEICMDLGKGGKSKSYFSGDNALQEQDKSEIPIESPSEQENFPGENSHIDISKDLSAMVNQNKSENDKNQQEFVAELDISKEGLFDKDITSSDNHSNSSLTIESPVVNEQTNSGPMCNTVIVGHNEVSLPQQESHVTAQSIEMQGTEQIELKTAYANESLPSAIENDTVLPKDINDINEQLCLTINFEDELTSNHSSEGTAPFDSSDIGCEKGTIRDLNTIDINTGNRIDTSNDICIPMLKDIPKYSSPKQEQEKNLIKKNDKNDLLMEFIEREQIHVDFGPDNQVNDTSLLHIDSEVIQAEIENGYDEESGLRRMLSILEKLGLYTYENYCTTNIKKIRKISSKASVSDKTEASDHDFDEGGEQNTEPEVRTQVQNVKESSHIPDKSQENKNKDSDEVLSVQKQILDHDASERLSSILEKEMNLSKLPKQKRKSEVLPRQEKCLGKNTKKPKTTDKKLKSKGDKCSEVFSNLQNYQMEKQINTDLGSEIYYAEKGSKDIDSKDEATVPFSSNENEPSCTAVEILESARPGSNNSQTENRSDEAFSCSEIIEINDHEGSTAEIKPLHSLRIKLKRKRTWVQFNEETSLESSEMTSEAAEILAEGLDFVKCNSEAKDTSMPVAKRHKREIPDLLIQSNNRKMEKTGNQNNDQMIENIGDRNNERQGVNIVDDKSQNKSFKKTTNNTDSVTARFSGVNMKIPVIKLKRIPFVNKIEISGLCLKFKGTKSKPSWKIETSSSDDSNDTCMEAQINFDRNDQIIQDKQQDLVENQETSDDRMKLINANAVAKDQEISSTESSKEEENLVHSKLKKHQGTKREKKNKETKNDGVISHLSVKEKTTDVKKEKYRKYNKKYLLEKNDCILPCHEKSDKLTEFDKALMNSGKLIKKKINHPKKTNLKETCHESNRDIIFGKSDKQRPVREDNIPLLLRSKLAQKIVNKDLNERNSKKEKLPDIPAITSLESLSFPPLSSSLATNNDTKESLDTPSKTLNSSRTVRPFSELKKSLESLGSVKDLINSSQKSIRLKDMLSNLQNPFENTPPFRSLFNSFDTLNKEMVSGDKETLHGKTNSWKQENSFKTLVSPFHADGLSPLSTFSGDNHRVPFDGNFTPRQENMNIKPKKVDTDAKLRLERSHFLSDSAFSSPEKFESGLLSPVSGGRTFMSEKMPANPFLFSSTPATLVNRKRSYPSIVATEDQCSAQKQFSFEQMDKFFTDMSGFGLSTSVNKSNIIYEAEHTGSNRADEEMTSEPPVRSGNSESMEIVSADASGIMTSGLSLVLSDSKVQEAVDWFRNKQTEKAGKVVEPAIDKQIFESGKKTENGSTLSTIILSKENISKISAPRGKVRLKRLETSSDSQLEQPCQKLEEVDGDPQKQNDADTSLSGICSENFSKINEKRVTLTEKTGVTCDNETDSSVAVSVGHQESVDENIVDKINDLSNSSSGLASEILSSSSSTSQYHTLDKTGFQINLDGSENFGEKEHGPLTGEAAEQQNVFDSSHEAVSNNYLDGNPDCTEQIWTAELLTPKNNSVISPLEGNDVEKLLRNSDEPLSAKDANSLNVNDFEHSNKADITSEVSYTNTEKKTINEGDVNRANDDDRVSDTNETCDDDSSGEPNSQSETLPVDEAKTDSDNEVDDDSVIDTEEDDTVERIDILSLYASDDASFLEEDDEEDYIVKMGVSDVKKKSTDECEVGDDVKSSSSGETSEPVDMELETRNSPSHSTDTPVEVNVALSTPLERQMIKDMVPTGYCFHFQTSGTCKNGISCRFKHEQPSKENKVKHWRQKMEQNLRQGELERSLALFQQLSKEDVVPMNVVKHMFMQCRQAGYINCFCLIKYMFENQFLTVDVINQYIYMCGNKSVECVHNLWEVFQRMVCLNIQPANDAMFILLRAFSDSEAWEWLWQVMLYCNETENFNMPVFCQEKALSAMLKDPSRYFNYASQWLFNSKVERLQKLDRQLLQEIHQLCLKSGETNLSQGMRTVLASDRATPRPRTPITPFLDGEEVEEEFNEDAETVRGWMNRFHRKYPLTLHVNHLPSRGVTCYVSMELHAFWSAKLHAGIQYSKNWDYLGELYVGRSTIHCPLPALYIDKITEILKTNEKIDEVFAEFLACTFKRYQIDSLDNEALKLDMKGLAVIGNSLLILCAEKQHWPAGYQILCHMVSYNIEHLKYCGGNPQIALVAMETCLQCFQPESALQILKETSKSSLESPKFSFIRGLFHGLFEHLFNKFKYLDCLYVLSVAFHIVFREHHHQESSTTSSLKECTCRLLKECLAQGDVPVAVKIFQLWREYQSPFIIDILLSRSLLVACLDMRNDDVAYCVFEMMKKAKIYPLQRIEKPRILILPLWATNQEMFLVIEDYLKWLYNSLCNNVLDNIRLSHTDLQLSVQLTGRLAPSNEQVPFLHGVAHSPTHAQKMVADVLSQMIPGISAIIQTNGTIIVEPRSLEGWLCATDNKNRRQGLRFSQPPMSRTGITGQLRPRGVFHRNPRPRVPR